MIYEGQASSKFVEVAQLIAKDVQFWQQKKVSEKEQVVGATSVSLNIVDLVVFKGVDSKSKQVEISTYIDSVGTGHSVVVDQRRVQVDAEEVFSPKRRK
ncbi:hypothetical protein ACOSQ4_004916 [Xanthoceras sorbifolium]